MKSKANRILPAILAAAMITGQSALGISAESYASDSAAEPEGYSVIKEAAGDAEMKALGESIRAGAVATVKTPQPEATTGTVYYISNDGDDANSGTSADAPWQSIQKVNVTTFEPGDMVLFEAGNSWQLEEPLHPLGSGTADAPIVIGAYGEGAKPCFDAKAVADDPNRAWAYGDVTKHSSDGLYLEDQSHIEVRDLEIVNAPDGYDGSDSTVQRNLRDDRRGIHVVATVGSTEKNIQGVYLHDLYVHDVTGDAMSATKWDSSKRSGGIVFETILKDETTGLPIIKDALSDTDLKGYEPAYFSNIIVENNILIDNGYSSIAFKQLKKWGVRPNGDKTTAPQYYHTKEQGWYPHYNITIRNNYLDHDKYELGANTIYLTNSKESLIEHNYCVGAGTSAIELNQADDIVVQYNEIYRARRKPTGADSNAIDPDRNATNILIQYNYIDSCGDGILLCGFNYGSSIVRYNVIKDSDSEKRYINIHGSKGHNYIYNNILYNSTGESATFIASSGGSNYLNNSKNHHYIYNNIFYSPNAVARLDDGSSLEYSNNSYYNVSAIPTEDTAAVRSMPVFKNIGSVSGGTATELTTDGILPAPTSPVIGAGRVVEADTKGNYPNTIISVATDGYLADFFGTKFSAEKKPSIGPAEFVSENASTGGISGTVTDLYGQTKSDVEVSVTANDGTVKNAVSDEYGFYAVYGVPIGAATVTAKLDDYADVVLTVQIADEILKQDILFDEPTTSMGAIRGVVTNGAGVTVDVVDADGKTVVTAMTSEDGTYQIADIPAGIYSVIFSCDGYDSVTHTDIEVKPAYVTALDDVTLPVTVTEVSFLLKENFDSYLVGAFDGGDAWNVYNPDGNGEKISIVEENGNKYLRLAQTDELGTAAVRVWNKEALNATGKFSLYTRIRSTITDGNASHSRFAIFTAAEIGQDGNISKPMADFGFYPAKLFVDDGTLAKPTQKYSCSYDTWYDIRLDVNMDTDTFDFYVDGVLKRANCGLRTAGDALNYVNVFGTDKYKGDILVDYIWVCKGTPDAETTDIESITVDELPNAEFIADADNATYTTDSVVPYACDQIKVRIKTANPFATVTIGTQKIGYADDSEYAVISLASGENLIPITITAAGDSAKSKTYTLKINRENADLLAYLTTLDISGITLNPAFTGENPAEDDVIFDGGETNEATHTLTWVSATDTMSVTVLVNGETVSTSNSGTTEIALQEGTNTIVLSAISASADEFKSYTINVQYVSYASEREESEIATPETATEF